MYKIIRMFLVAFGVLRIFVDTQSDWYAGLKVKKDLTRIQVGDEHVRMDNITLPYRFTGANAILNSTLGGYRLDLSNASVASSGTAIWADGDLAVFVQGENILTAGSGMGGAYGGIQSYASVLVFGSGSLIVRPYAASCNFGIEGSSGVSVIGSNISIYGADRGMNTWSGDVLLSLSTVGIYNVQGAGIYSQLGSVSILGAAVSISGQAGLRVSENIVIDGSTLNVLAKEFGTYYYAPDIDNGVFTASHSYLSMIVAGEDGEGHKVIAAPHVYFDNCVVSLYCGDCSCIYADDVYVGNGDYRFGTTRPHSGCRS